MRRPAALISAFTDSPLQGNGAAVVLLDQPAAPTWMQGVASQLRQSETAFLLPMERLDPTAPDGGWALRWFTPTCEVSLCGHATLAATLALGHWSRLEAGSTTSLRSRSGRLPVKLEGLEPDRASIVLPGSDLRPQPLPQDLGALLGARPLESWSSGLGYWVARLSEDDDLGGLDGPGLARSLEGDLRQGLVLMQSAGRAAWPAVQGKPADYGLRFFAPGLGIEEDPVTGSAHALVAPWWCARLGRESVVGWQPSAKSGGMLCERLLSGMIRLSGSGQLLWDGHLSAGSGDGSSAEWCRCLAASG